MNRIFDRYKVIDVDTHISEPPDVWTSRVSSRRHSSNKPEGEKWAVGRLLKTQHISFDEEELVKREEEPVDIEFRNARFQVKELLENGFRPGDRLKDQIKLLDKVKSAKGIIKPYEPWSISWHDIVLKVEEELKLHTSKKYGPNERAFLDLLFYFNYSNDEISGPFERVLKNGEGFRSVSLVTSSYCGVLYADSRAPDFLRTIYGKIQE